MGVTWTKEQKQVIELRKRNILVSAAAGSGKTAVLVERIVSMVSDAEHPIDIDRLLIVTFTKAAAGEMKERISQALERKLAEHPKDEHLQRQTALVHHAQITTIDSFCSHVVRNYFHMIDLDPGYRMGEEGEMKLMQSDVAGQVLEAAYEKKEEDFLEFIESYSTGKTDEGIEELMLKLYTFSMSYPWPVEWLQECKKAYAVTTKEELNQTSWMQKIEEDVSKSLKDAMEIVLEAIANASQEGGPYMYLEALNADRQFLELLLAADSFTAQYELMQRLTFPALSRKRDANISNEAKSVVKALREQVKKIVKELKEQYFFSNIDEVLADIRQARVPVSVLIDLTIAFAEAFATKKREKNILDFADLEHFALDILIQHTEEGDILTSAAKELADTYEEILIDEYQDSNFVQELLLSCVSRIARGEHNLFMVGDVKQSIYRFRLARPELFMTKFRTYSTEESNCQRIDLHKNFRSRAGVLNSVNFIFEQIMGQELGDVDYDNDAALYPGAIFLPKLEKEQDTKEYGTEESNTPEFLDTEVLLIETDDDEWEEMESRETNMELEARAVAAKIQEIVGKEEVLDKETGTYRKARYQDCVILLRTMHKWADTFGRILSAQGVPASVTSRTGYFSAQEVITVLNYLHILDNPCQEIPFTGILHSAIGRLSAEELAIIKCKGRADAREGKMHELPMYECALAYADNTAMEGTVIVREKLKQFFAVYQSLREKVSYTPIHQLIWEILIKTGYGEYVKALPAGGQRTANLQMLIEKASDFEQTSYRGLFHFIRYIEHLQKYQMDFGEASTLSENEDTVRIMSIHKSKGLEFPIVFVSGMGKRFNLQDARSKLVIHADMGIGADAIDYKLRTKTPTLLKKAIQKQTVLESLGEELRVLYVALTRAKEKLILSGTVGKLEKKVEKYALLQAREETRLSYGMRARAACYWDWVLPSLARHRGMDELYIKYEKGVNPLHPLYDHPAAFQIHCISPTELVEEEVFVQGMREVLKERFLSWDNTVVYDEDMKRELEERFNFAYPYENRRDIPVKVSVSEVKRRSFTEEEARPLYEEEEKEIVPFIPAFMQGNAEMQSSAWRGTAYHKMVECLDYERASTVKEVREQLQELVDSNKMTQDMAECIWPKDICQFAKSTLGQRMQQAKRENCLFREQQFVIEVSAAELSSEWPKEEKVLVQGIIDAFFFEEGEIVVADYKTDRVLNNNPQYLVDKYRIQLDYYAKALERMTGMRVKERVIYSFSLGREIIVL